MGQRFMNGGVKRPLSRGFHGEDHARLSNSAVDDPAAWNVVERRLSHATLARKAGSTLAETSDVAKALGLFVPELKSTRVSLVKEGRP